MPDLTPGTSSSRQHAEPDATLPGCPGEGGSEIRCQGLTPQLLGGSHGSPKLWHRIPVTEPSAWAEPEPVDSGWRARDPHEKGDGGPSRRPPGFRLQ